MNSVVSQLVSLLDQILLGVNDSSASRRRLVIIVELMNT